MQVSRKTALEMQTGKAAESTPEKRLEALRYLLTKDGVGSPAARERWQAEVKQIELDIECQKAIEIVAANVNQFKYLREAVAFACLRAEEQQFDFLDEPTTQDLLDIEAEQELTNDTGWLASAAYGQADMDGIERLPIDPRTEEFWEPGDWQDERNSRPFPL